MVEVLCVSRTSICGFSLSSAAIKRHNRLCKRDAARECSPGFCKGKDMEPFVLPSDSLSKIVADRSLFRAQLA